MKHDRFQEWLSGIDALSEAQRQQAQSVLLGKAESSASLEAVEARLAETRECPHCGTAGAISRGKARGLRRYQVEQYKKMRAEKLREEERALQSMREMLDNMGKKAYSYARIVYSYSWLKGLGLDSAPVWANFFDNYFKDQGLAVTEWTNMKFGDEK